MSRSLIFSFRDIFMGWMLSFFWKSTGVSEVSKRALHLSTPDAVHGEEDQCAESDSLGKAQ